MRESQASASARRAPGTYSFVLVCLLLLPCIAVAQVTETKSEAAKGAASTRGQGLFREYCASCHGIGGKGDGPMAASLKTPPANLTALSARNKGQFPSLRVMQAIKAGPSVPAHGSPAMPVWGPIFLRGDQAEAGVQSPPRTDAAVAEEREQVAQRGPSEAEVQLRIYNLTEYIKTLQTK